MGAVSPVVFLLDVDNTLLDNDRVAADLKRYLAREVGVERQERYWVLFEQLRVELGYADYLGALQRYRIEHPRDPHLLAVSSFLANYPFATRLFPESLDVIDHLGQWGPTVILSDGDVVFQPRKVERSGLLDAVEGRVLIYIHKERELDDVEQRYPSTHYVLVDDKLRILTAVKKFWGERVTTIFPRQGHYAHDPEVATYPPADLTLGRIGELLRHDLPALLSAGQTRRKRSMKATQRLRDAGQSLWLDQISRGLLTGGGLERYIADFSVSGLTSNPTIFNHAIRNSHHYDAAIRTRTAAGSEGEALLLELALEDLTQAADLFRPIHDATNRVDGWVSLELSPKLAFETTSSLVAAKDLYARAALPNLFIKIPGTRDGIPAIEEAIFAGVPINVTLLFSREQYLAAAHAYLRGIERRVAAGLNPHVPSVASLFVSRWDVAVAGTVPPELHGRLGIAIAKRTYKAYRDLFASDRWLRLLNVGARSQRLLWASTGTKDPRAPDVLYVMSLAAPHTINTMPEQTLLALADHGEIGPMLPRDGGDAEEILDRFAQTGVDLDALAARLQQDGAAAFVQSWDDLLACLAEKSDTLRRAG
jgi:transaldolase